MTKKKNIKKPTNTRNFLSKLHLKNFKSFFGPAGSPAINIKFARRITLLFGRNSAGKSSIIQAIKLIQQSHENDSDFLLTAPQSYLGGINFPSYNDIVSKKEVMRSIHLGITATEGEYYTNGVRSGRPDDHKSIIKKFNYENNNIIPSEVDFYSPSDDEDKFLSIKNSPLEILGRGLPDKYYKSEISYTQNKYAWKELFEYTYKFRKKIIPYLERCIEFSQEWKKITSKKNKNSEKEMEKIFQQSLRIGSFHPFNFRFRNDQIIKKHIFWLSRMENNYDKFLSYINVDIRNNKKFAYKNNRTFRANEIIEKFTYTADSSDIEKLYDSLEVWTTLSDILCFVVSLLCGSKYPRVDTFDPNNKNQLEKTLSSKKMIEFCSERVASTIQNIRIFQGQKPLPSQYENIPAFEKDFVGYNYEFLNQVISDHRRKIDKWLNHFGYDFKITTESGGPTSVTLIQHKKRGFKVDYKQGGLGAENVLPIITQSVAANNKILVFEEPERRAHPRLQSKLADLIVESSLNNQFIIETHSENFLLGILKNIRDGKIDHKDVQVSYVHIDKDQSLVDELTLNDKGSFESNWRHGFFTERLDLI